MRQRFERNHCGFIIAVAAELHLALLLQSAEAGVHVPEPDE